MRDLRPELQLLATAARSVLEPAAEKRLGRLIRSPIDWSTVLEEGAYHGVLPLLYLHLADRQEISSPVRRRLRDRFEAVTRHNLYLSAELLGVVDAFGSEGIETIALKGPVMATSLYPSLSLREFGDLDLLVRQEDVSRAVGIVHSLGYEPWQETKGAQEKALRHMEYSRTFTRERDGLDLDLHWDIARSFFTGRFNSEVLWSSDTKMELHGREVRGLSPTYLLFLLCVHGAKHGPFPWPRLKWICDIAEFVRSQRGFDWEASFEGSRDLRCHRMVLLGLALASELLDGDLPSPVRAELESAPDTWDYSARVWSWLDSVRPVSPSFAARARFDLGVHDTARDRIGYLSRRVTTPTRKDWRIYPLPRPLGFLYVPLRIARLIARYTSDPRRLLSLLRVRKGESEAGGGD